MTPLELEIILHYHSSPTDLPWCVDDDPAPCRDDTMNGLVGAGLLVRERPQNAPGRDNRQFYPTDKLHAFVEMLCSTPLPQQEWVDPRNLKVARRSIINDCSVLNR